MKKGAFIFPGVGSQHVGMGKEFYDNFKVVRDTFEEAGDVLGFDMADVCFPDTGKKDLAGLKYSQTALLTLSTATYKVYRDEVGSIPLYCLGHSLGEYSALCCAGVVKFPDALSIVGQRGEILDNVAAAMDGLMAWVINLDTKIVDKICGEKREEGEEIYVSAYDAPTQSSISGHSETVLKTGRTLESEGAIVYPLRLSGPFHSPLMKPAAEQLRTVLERYEYSEAVYPVIANYNAGLYKDRDSVIDNLSMQLMNPVRWEASVRFLLEQGIEYAVELGPDVVLKHLMKNNTDLIRTFSMRNRDDLDTVKENRLNHRN